MNSNDDPRQPMPPTHLRLLKVDGDLRRCDDRIAELEERMTATQERMKAALITKKTLLVERTRLLNLPGSAPVSMVPDDVLSFIMLLANEFDTPSEYDERPDPEAQKKENRLMTMMPFTLSQVDRQFRRVAISTGRLWATISILTPGPMARVRLHLSRTKKCLLDIELHITALDVRPQINEVFDMLPPPDRWRSLRIQTDVPYSMMEVALRRCIEPAPNLSRLELDCNSSTYGSCYRDDVTPALNIFSGRAPLLSSLVVWSVPLLWHTDMLHGLTRLEVCCIPHEHGPTLQELQDVLRHAPKLKVFVVRGIDSTALHYPIPPCGAVVELDVLRELTLSDVQPATAKWILSSISAPALQSLNLDLWNNQEFDYTETHREALDVIKRTPYAAVWQLKLLNVCIDDFADFGRQFPRVRELELTYADIAPEDPDHGELFNEYDENYGMYWSCLGRLTRPSGGEEPPFKALQCLKWFGPPTDDLIKFVKYRKERGVGPHKVLLNYDVNHKFFHCPSSFPFNLSALRRIVSVGYYGGNRWDQQVLEDFKYRQW